MRYNSPGCHTPFLWRIIMKGMLNKALVLTLAVSVVPAVNGMSYVYKLASLVGYTNNNAATLDQSLERARAVEANLDANGSYIFGTVGQTGAEYSHRVCPTGNSAPSLTTRAKIAARIAPVQQKASSYINQAKHSVKNVLGVAQDKLAYAWQQKVKPAAVTAWNAPANVLSSLAQRTGLSNKIANSQLAKEIRGTLVSATGISSAKMIAASQVLLNAAVVYGSYKVAKALYTYAKNNGAFSPSSTSESDDEEVAVAAAMYALTC